MVIITRLEIERTPGVQLRIIKSMRQLEMRATQHSIKETPFGEAFILTLQFEGHDQTEEAIRAHLQTVPGVRMVEKVEFIYPDQELEQINQAAETKKPNPRDLDDEKGDHEIRDRMLVFSLLGRYPKLAARLHELTSVIPPVDRPTRLQEVGQTFGKYLAAQVKPQAPVSDLRSAMTHLIVPAVEPMAEISCGDQGVEIRTSLLNLKKDKPEIESCYFLLGTLKGLLLAAEGLPPHKVQKVSCMTMNDDGCKYAISPE